MPCEEDTAAVRLWIESLLPRRRRQLEKESSGGSTAGAAGGTGRGVVRAMNCGRGNGDAGASFTLDASTGCVSKYIVGTLDGGKDDLVRSDGWCGVVHADVKQVVVDRSKTHKERIVREQLELLGVKEEYREL